MIKGKLDSKRNVRIAYTCVLVKDYFTARNRSPLTLTQVESNFIERIYQALLQLRKFTKLGPAQTTTKGLE